MLHLPNCPLAIELRIKIIAILVAIGYPDFRIVAPSHVCSSTLPAPILLLGIGLKSTRRGRVRRRCTKRLSKASQPAKWEVGSERLLRKEIRWQGNMEVILQLLEVHSPR